ncbi:MAG: TonB-dependent receptor, partial [Nitrospinota bacterium]|nr:TonB-dependent receptor [Nitrospinota bacterium]
MSGFEMSAAMAGEVDEMRQLLALIETQTEIATKEKMNADFVPGIITLLHGERMEALGARTVGEAISMTPGVEFAVNNAGDPMTIIRGIGNSHHSGHVQIQLNSVTINKTFDGSATSAFFIPIEQVERIEIIRGPGASLHGEFAYSGVINIITKQSNRAYISGGAFGTSGSGLSYSYENPESGAFFYLNGSTWQTDGSGVDSGPDHFASDGVSGQYTLSPGPIDDEEDHTLGVIRLGVGGVELLAQNARRHYYGMIALPSRDTEGWQEENLSLARVTYKADPTDKLKIKIYADAAENTFEVKNHMISPPGAPTQRPPSPSAPPPPPGPADGGLLSNYYGERKTGAGVEASYNGWNRQKWLAQAQYSRVAMEGVWQEFNFDPKTGASIASPRRYEGEDLNWLTPGKERVIISMALQDQIAVSENLNVTLGVRSDDFDDAGASVSPRLAGVWRRGPHIIKAQYAHAYRPPTFAELYSPTSGVGRLGNPDLEAERSQTVELGYIHNQPG